MVDESEHALPNSVLTGQNVKIDTEDRQGDSLVCATESIVNQPYGKNTQTAQQT